MYRIEPDQSGQGVRGGCCGMGGCGGVFLDEEEICAKKTCIVPFLPPPPVHGTYTNTQARTHTTVCIFFAHVCAGRSSGLAVHAVGAVSLSRSCCVWCVCVCVCVERERERARESERAREKYRASSS
jgi:hypothetical protein